MQLIGPIIENKNQSKILQREKVIHEFDQGLSTLYKGGRTTGCRYSTFGKTVNSESYLFFKIGKSKLIVCIT